MFGTPRFFFPCPQKALTSGLNDMALTRGLNEALNEAPAVVTAQVATMMKDLANPFWLRDPGKRDSVSPPHHQ